jgi:hypothetical protein
LPLGYSAAKRPPTSPSPAAAVSATPMPSRVAADLLPCEARASLAVELGVVCVAVPDASVAKLIEPPSAKLKRLQEGSATPQNRQEARENDSRVHAL